MSRSRMLRELTFFFGGIRIGFYILLKVSHNISYVTILCEVTDTVDVIYSGTRTVLLKTDLGEDVCRINYLD